MLLIFLLVPEAATQKHLEILSEIAELLSDAGLREQIKSSTDAAAASRPDRRMAVRPGGLTLALGRPALAGSATGWRSAPPSA